ncbi:MAG: copper chaperone PCu(A)C [Bacillota bacterium]|nr:copper chaperone PCu(A)C [Bacillota bacterium]
MEARPRWMRRAAVAAVASLLLLAGCAARAASPASGKNSLRLRQAWARAAEAGQNAAVYLTIENPTGQADRLLDVRTDVAGRAELHQSRMNGGVMEMQPVTGGLEVGAGKSLSLAPGGYHIMLFDLRRSLRPGDRFQLQLRFRRAGLVEVPVEVRSAAAAMPGM